MAAEVPFLAATHKAFPRLFARQNKNSAPSASLWLTNISVQVCLVLIWLTGSDYNTLLTIASEMILVPYFLVGAYLLKIATRPAHYAVASAPVFTVYGCCMLPDRCICCCPWCSTRRACWCLSTLAVRISLIMPLSAAKWR